MAVTQNTYTGDGTTVLFSFTFPYLETTDIKVSVNGTNTTAYTLANATTIQFNTAPANGAAIRIYRQTDDSALAATFYPGSAIRSADLNENFTQNLYVTQESNNISATATTTANTALTNSNTAISTANSAVSTANTASTNASAAVATANTASTNASAAVSTANTASTNATAAVNTANTASTNASNAVTTANTALSTANTASTNASAAVATANTASSNASAAVSTANTASSNATTAVNTANNALSTANAAQSTANTADANANAALNAIAGTVQYVLVANVAAIPSSPGNGDAIEIADSTGIESFSPLNNRPAGFVGDSGLSVRLQYLSAGSSWNWLNYFPNNADTRYLKFGGGTITGNLEIGNTGSLTFEGSTANAFETTLAVTDPTADRTITLPDVSGTVVTTGDTGSVTSTMIANGTIVDADINATAAIDKTKINGTAITAADTGTVTSTMIADGTIVNSDVNASAAIAGTKISPDFGSQNVTTTGTVTGASLNPTSSTVPTNGVYLPSANTVGISANSTGRLFVDSNGNLGVGISSIPNYNANLRTVSFNNTNGVVHDYAVNGVRTGSIVCQSTALELSTQTNIPLVFSTNSAERMRLTSTGLGIGTSSPGVALDVVGDTRTSSRFYGDKLVSYTATNSSFVQLIPRNAVGTEVVALHADVSGRVGIGTTSPGAPLEVNGNVRITNANNLQLANTGDVQFLNAAGTSYSTGIVGSSDNMILYTTDLERCRLDSSGRLLVGTSSTSSITSVLIGGNSADPNGYGALRLARNTATPANGDSIGYIVCGDNTHTDTASINFQRDGGTWSGSSKPTRLVFSTCPDGSASPVERLRISANGEITVTAGNNYSNIVYTNTGANGTPLCYFQTASAELGKIRINGAGVAYDTTSDYRLKENIEPITDAIVRLQALKPWRFNFISHPDATVDGFLAHEAQEIVPEAVSGHKDEVNTDGKPIYQGIDQSKLVPLLTAALQEAVAKIESLEARLTAAGI